MSLKCWAICCAGVLAVTSFSHASATGTLYRDPQDRFTLQVPTGWKLRPLGDSVQVVRGDAYVSVMIFDHDSDAESLVRSLSRQISSKWKQSEEISYGTSSVAGLSATSAAFSGINPQGVEAVLQMAGTSAKGTAYVLVMSSPKSDLQKVRAILGQIAASFRLLSGTTEKKESHPTLGIEVTDLSPEDAKAYGLAEPSGAMVVQVAEGGPAQKAGVQLHDLVIACGGQAIDSAAMLQQVIGTHKSGEELTLEIVRPDKNGNAGHITLKAELDSE